MNTIYMISGFAGSGKDTVANILCGQFSHVHGSFAFADSLKIDTANTYHLPLNWFYERQFKDSPIAKHNGATPRQLLLETARIAREMDINVYSRRVVTKIDDLFRIYPKARAVVISDWRYQREYDHVRESFDTNIVRIRVVRNNVSADEQDLANEPMDIILDNSGTLQELQEQVNTIFAAPSFHTHIEQTHPQ